MKEGSENSHTNVTPRCDVVPCDRRPRRRLSRMYSQPHDERTGTRGRRRMHGWSSHGRTVAGENISEQVSSVTRSKSSKIPLRSVKFPTFFQIVFFIWAGLQGRISRSRSVCESVRREARKKGSRNLALPNEDTAPNDSAPQFPHRLK